MDYREQECSRVYAADRDGVLSLAEQESLQQLFGAAIRDLKMSYDRAKAQAEVLGLVWSVKPYKGKQHPDYELLSVWLDAFEQEGGPPWGIRSLMNALHDIGVYYDQSERELISNIPIGDYEIWHLGILYPDEAFHYGLGASLDWAFGIGDTPDEAFDDALETLAQGVSWDLSDELVEQWRAELPTGTQSATEYLEEVARGEGIDPEDDEEWQQFIDASEGPYHWVRIKVTELPEDEYPP